MTPFTATTPRIQATILSRMDLRTFTSKAFKLPLLKDAMWEDAVASPAARSVFRLVGRSTLQSLVSTLVFSFLPADSPDLSSEHQIICSGLLSAATYARLLLATGDYEDVPPCPFYGMDAPEPGEVFEIYVGASVVSSVHGLLRFRPWFTAVFTDLACGAVKAMLNPRARPRLPKMITKYADIPSEPKRKRQKVPSIKPRNALSDTTNTASTATASDYPSQFKVTAIVIPKPQKATSRWRKGRNVPYMTTIQTAAAQFHVAADPVTIQKGGFFPGTSNIHPASGDVEYPAGPSTWNDATWGVAPNAGQVGHAAITPQGAPWQTWPPSLQGVAPPFGDSTSHSPFSAQNVSVPSPSSTTMTFMLNPIPVYPMPSILVWGPGQ
ncbi:hypothetical protein B0H10DRAFT_2039195 [Mycena sp. CBHHK59/15]|nr:hypothetical protein B0H10DRAFT_2039195 [Mycena sp. CBHHK59/15]